jgi:hypothetical protein
MHSTCKVTRPFIALAALLFALTGALAAQTTGKIEGRVFDASTNQPLAGAQVVVVGSGLGNITNKDGYYFINNVPAGVHDVRATYIGYRLMTVSNQRVLSGQTMTVDFRLQPEAVAIEAITVQGETNPLVPRDKTVTKQIVTGDVVDQLPVDNVRRIITLQPGVVETGDARGQVIRGGRPGEASVYVDGILVRNFNAGRQSRLDVGTNAVEEVNLLTGGYGAEYGSAQSGIINYITKRGGQHWTGAVNFGTDAFLPKDYSYGISRLEASLGGPISGERLTFHAAGTAGGFEDASPDFLNVTTGCPISICGETGINLPAQRFYFRPTGKAPYLKADGTPLLDASGKPIEYTTFDRVELGENRQPYSNNDTYTGSLTTFLTLDKNTRLSLGALASRGQGLGFSSYNQFRPKAIGAFINKGQLFRASLDRILFQTAESQATVRFNVAYGKDSEKSGQRADTVALEPEGPDFLGFKVSDYELLFDNKITYDKYMARVDSINQGLASKYLTLVETIGLTPSQATPSWSSNYSADNPYGLLGYFAGVGFNGGYGKAEEKTLTFDVDLDWQANRIHRFGAGAELYKKTVENLGVSTLGGTVVFDNVYRVKPDIGAIWVKDRMDIGEMVLDLGLRWDMYRSDAQYPVIPGLVLPFVPDAGAAGLELCAAPPTTQGGTCLPKFEKQANISTLSPRLGVAFPVTDATNFRLSYGHFFQIPELRNLFNCLNTDLSASNTNCSFGRPIKALKAVQFEAGFSHLFNAATALDITAYNKDKLTDVSFRIDLVNWPASRRGPQEARVLTNLDFGNSKGLDARLTRRVSQQFTVIAGYSYLNSRGTGSDPTSYISSFGRYTDPVTGVALSPAQALQYTDFDQRHKFSVVMVANFDQNTSNPLLRNMNISMESLAGSGLPYTHSSTPGALARGATGARYSELLNSSRLPWTYSTDLKITRGVRLGGTNISLFADARNLFNARNISDVYGYTGSPTDPGNIETEAGGGAGADRNLTTLTDPELKLLYTRQQDLLKLYGLADDNDDVVTTLEQKKLRALGLLASERIETHYGTPRRLRFGFEWVF